MEMLYAVGLALIAILAILGIFSRLFNDNLLQRAGLAFLASGCVMLLFMRSVGLVESLEVRPRVLSQLGILLYAIGTAFKAWRAKL